MTAWFTTCACLCLLPGALLAADTNALPLPDAIARALENNQRVRAAQLSAQSSALGIEQADAEFDYRLTPAAETAAGSDAHSVGYGVALGRKLAWGTDVSAGADVTHTEFDEADDVNVGRVSVRLDQPLFRQGGKLVQLEPLRLAQSRYKQSLRLLENTKADLVLDVAERYERVLRAEHLTASEQQTVLRLEKLLRLTSARERQGRATHLDVLRVDLLLGQARGRLSVNQEQVASQQRALAELLGEAPTQTYVLQRPPRLDLDLPPPDLAAATALSNRLEYAQALQDITDARRGERVAGRQLWPDLRLTTRVEQTGAGPRQADAFHPEDTLWAVGLTGDTDLNPRRARASYEAAAVNTSAAELDAEIIRVRIIRDVYDQLGAYRRAGLDYELAERNYALARKRRDLATRLYDKGRTDSMSVTDAEDAFLSAENARYTAEAEASVAGYRVLRATGTLIAYPDELKVQVP